MELYILRHGVAEVQGGLTSGGDSQRRLTAEGRLKMRRVARGMKALGLGFDVILSSPYLRAKETAEIVAATLEIQEKLKLTPALASNGNPKELIDGLRRTYRRKKRILLVGHEPYLSRLASLLMAGGTGIAITLKKGGVCKLTVGTLHYGRCATLEWLVTASQMRRMR